MGVFATRSPFRPNAVGLSAVRLDGIADDPARGPVLLVSGADLMDNTPILDIKPYLPYADCIPDAAGGFAVGPGEDVLEVDFPPALLDRVPADRRQSLIEVLARDPRPRYQNDPARIYGFVFAGLEIRFSVADTRLTVMEVLPAEGRQ